MKCPKCGFTGNISDGLIPTEGKSVGCPKCRERFFVRKPVSEPSKPRMIPRAEPAPPPVPAQITVEDMFKGLDSGRGSTETNVEVLPPQPVREAGVNAAESAVGRNVAKCPRCGSPSVSLAQEGFGGKKAGCGCCLLGPLGLLFGFFGSGKTSAVCMNCGHRWKPGPSKKTGCCIGLGLIAIVLLIVILVSYGACERDSAKKTPAPPPPAPAAPAPPAPETIPTAQLLTPIYTPEELSETVYVSVDDYTYHRETCELIKDRAKIPMTREKAIEEAYSPCGVCNP